MNPGPWYIGLPLAAWHDWRLLWLTSLAADDPMRGAPIMSDTAPNPPTAPPAPEKTPDRPDPKSPKKPPTTIPPADPDKPQDPSEQTPF